MRFLKYLDSEEDAEHPMTWVANGCFSLMITFRGETEKAWISPDKKIIVGIPGLQPFHGMVWITPEEAAEIRSRPKQPVTAPEVPFPLNPGKPGKLVVITGTPGAGKSTTAATIAKRANWVYYEGDGFTFGYNPYAATPNESQEDECSSAPALIGPGMADRWEALRGAYLNGQQLEANLTTDRSPTFHYFRLKAEDIKKERERVGGNFIVADAISERCNRDVIREVLDDAIFVVLDIPDDLLKERLKNREIDRNLGCLTWLQSMARLQGMVEDSHKFEAAQIDEPRTVAFRITKESTEEQNAEAILDLINKAGD